ncbi:hypothetical protein [Erythrobacter sp. Alg231-14]|uniref:hypothetical protein n=1 Tax=Erythrobacter sp. Alg231-14 TaxID=1922225 RepID=UPI000D558EE4
MVHRVLTLLAFIAGGLVLAQPASAKWYEAQSDYFVIYANAEEDEVRLYAENLERYHSAMENFTGRTVAKPSPSNRVTVYSIGSADQLRRLAGSRSVAGFYLPRWDGSFAFVQDVENKQGLPTLSTVVLLHEYAHHFLSSTERFAMPLWMNEGAAEFFSNVYFGEDGSVYLGTRAQGRDLDIFVKPDEMMSVSQLLTLDWERLRTRNTTWQSAFYGRSWLLYHYFSMKEERSGQLREYWLEVLSGTPSLDAAKKVFGDLGVIERQLYLHYRDLRQEPYRVAPEDITAGAVSIRPLSDGEAATMHIQMGSDRGVVAEDVEKLAEQARDIARSFPDDPKVLTVLAHAEYGAGHDAAAIAAARRAIAVDPAATRAYVVQGRAGFRLARAITDPEERGAAYREAMVPLLALNAMEPEHTVPLVYMYRSFAEQDAVPSDDAKAALVRAAQLAPFDQELWLIAGMMHMNDGRISEARAALQPLASNPHGGEKAAQIGELLAFLSDKHDGQAIPVQSAISAYFVTE